MALDDTMPLNCSCQRSESRWLPFAIVAVCTFSIATFCFDQLSHPVAGTELHAVFVQQATSTVPGLMNGAQRRHGSQQKSSILMPTPLKGLKEDSASMPDPFQVPQRGVVAGVAAGVSALVAALMKWTGTKQDPMEAINVDHSLGRRATLASIAVGTMALHGVQSASAANAPVQRLDPEMAQQRYDEARLEEYNRRIQAINRVPGGFPTFIRDGYNVKIKVPEAYTTLPSGLVVYDFPTSNLEGPTPKDGQKVIFHYTAYNENGARIDSSYTSGRPMEQVVGIGGMVPGFEEGIRGMHIGGQRRIIVPPELGPPVGPSTFFSAKQYEVFDIELLDILDCRREGFSITSRLVCTKGPV